MDLFEDVFDATHLPKQIIPPALFSEEAVVLIQVSASSCATSSARSAVSYSNRGVDVNTIAELIQFMWCKYMYLFD